MNDDNLWEDNLDMAWPRCHVDFGVIATSMADIARLWNTDTPDPLIKAMEELDPVWERMKNIHRCSW